MGFCRGVFSLWKKDWEKSLQKMFIQTQSEISVHILFQRKMQILQPRQLLQRNHMIRINSYPRETGRQFFGFDPWLSFLLRWYLSLKIWVKPLVSRRSISHRLLCVPFFILTLQGLGRGVRWIKLIFALKLLFCLGGNFVTFPKTYLEIFSEKDFALIWSQSPMTSPCWSHGENVIFQKCDVNKIISSKVYKLSIFEICI